MKGFLFGVALAGVLLSACGGTQTTPFAVVVSSNGSVGEGEQRVLFALVDPETDEFLASEDREATMTLHDENGAPIETYPMFFVGIIQEVRGIYGANIVIPEAGTYQVTIDADGLNTAGPVGLLAAEDPPVVQLGEPAPPSETRTAAEYPDLSVISSDPEPDPAMYQLSVDEAVSNGRPSIVVFATPAWCVSAACGPLLAQVKALQPDFEDVDFVHVEVYDDIQVSTFEELVLVPAVIEWGLLAEPWVFVMDRNGEVTGSYEGAASDDELREALEAVAP
jgi:hypothetical protein